MDDPASTHELEHEPVDAGSTGSGDASVADSAVAPVEHDTGAPVESDSGSDPVLDSGNEYVDCSTDPSPDAGTDAGEVADAAPAEEMFTAVYALIAENCTSCHSAGKTFGDFSTRELAYAQLVGVSARMTACTADAGIMPVRVVPGDPDTSLLIQKLENRQTCGAQMPKAMLLPQENVDVFRAWVVAGAPEH